MRLSKFLEFKFGIPDVITNVWSHPSQNKNALGKPMKLLKCVNKKRSSAWLVIMMYSFS